MSPNYEPGMSHTEFLRAKLAARDRELADLKESHAAFVVKVDELLKWKCPVMLVGNLKILLMRLDDLRAARAAILPAE